MKKVYNQPEMEELEVLGSSILVDSILGPEIENAIGTSPKRYRPNA